MAEGTVAGEPPVTDDKTGASVPEAVAALPDVEGAVSTRPDVMAARSAVVAARERLGTEVDQLERSARATFDVKARITGIPQQAREDPARSAAVAGVAVGAVAAMTALVRRARRPKRRGFLPADVEEAVSRFGKNGDKVRRSLEDSFATYLREHGAQEPSKRRGVPPVVGMVAAPIAGAVARELLKRVTAPPPDAGARASSTDPARGDEAPKGASAGH